MRLTKRFMDWYQGNNDKEKETPTGRCEESWLCTLELRRQTGWGKCAVPFVLYSNRDDSGSSVSTEPLSFGEFTG